MKRHLWKHLFALLLVVCVACVFLAGCVNTEEDGGGGGGSNTETPDNSMLYANELSNAIANAIALNPKTGFAMDLAASAAFAFDKEEKKQYDWGYSVEMGGNLFADGADKQGFWIELKNDKASADQIAAGEDIILGLYNTAEEHLYVQAGKTKFNFENVSVFAALKAILLANNVNLDVVLKDLEIAGVGTIGGIAGLALSMLATNFDEFEKVEAGYNVKFKLSTMLDMVVSLIAEVGNMQIELPAELTATDINFDILFKVKNNTFVGIELKDNKLTTKDAEGNGTLNINADFNVSQTTVAINVLEKVSTELQAIPQTKVLNLEAKGKIDMTKPDTAESAADGAMVAANKFEWEIHANMDLFKMLEENFVLGATSIANNYLHFRLAMNGEVFLDIAWAPDQLESGDLVIVANLPQLLTALGEEGLIGTVCDTLGIARDYILQIDSTALGYLIGGQGGLIPTPGTGGGGEVTPPAPAPGLDIGALVDQLMSVVGSVSVGTGEINMDLTVLLNMLSDLAGPDILNIINGLTAYATDARFYDTTAAFANPAISYDVKDRLMKEPTADGEKDRDFYSSKKLIAGVFNKQYVTNDGFLKLWQSSKMVLDAKTTPISIAELNDFITNGSTAVRYTGTDISGKTIAENSSYSSKIMGYYGVDTSLIGVPQEVTIITSWADPQGLINLAGGFMKDLPLVQPMAQMKAKIVLSEIESMENVLKNNSKNIEEYVYRTGDKFARTGTAITTTVTYKASEYFPDGATKVIETSGSTAAKDTSMIRVTDIGTTLGKKGYSETITTQENFVVKGIAIGIPFEKTVQVKAAETITFEGFTYPSATPNAMVVGDNVPTANNFATSFKFAFAYDDGVSHTGITLPVSDMILLNGMEMLGVNEYSEVTADTVWLKAGTLKVRFKLNGKHDIDGEFEVKVVERTASYDTSLVGMETKNGSINGKINISVKDETQIATQNAFVAFKAEVYYFDKKVKAYTKTVVANTTITIDGMSGGSSGILLKDMADTSYNFTINGAGIVATEKYYVKVTIVELQSGKALSTTPVAAAFIGIDLIDDLSTYGTLANRVSLEVGNGLVYKLAWVEGTYVFRAEGFADVAATIVFKNAEGEDITATALNDTNGRPIKGTKGTITVSATYNEVEYTVTGVVDL